LGGKKYMMESASNDADSSLTLIPGNHKIFTLKPDKYLPIKGYPASNAYEKYQGETKDTCQEKCNVSRDCGNYFFTEKNGECWIDASANTRPIYNTTQANGLVEKNPPSIYIAKRNMKSGFKSSIPFNSKPAGEYSSYTIKPEPLPSKEFESVTDEYTKKVITLSEMDKNLGDLSLEVNGIEGFSDIPERYLKRLPLAPDTSVEEGRISDLQAIMYQQNVLYSLSSIAALSFLAGAIVLARN
jgi:hypothetical protein